MTTKIKQKKINIFALANELRESFAQHSGPMDPRAPVGKSAKDCEKPRLLLENRNQVISTY